MSGASSTVPASGDNIGLATRRSARLSTGRATNPSATAPAASPASINNNAASPALPSPSQPLPPPPTPPPPPPAPPQPQSRPTFDIIHFTNTATQQYPSTPKNAPTHSIVDILLTCLNDGNGNRLSEHEARLQLLSYLMQRVKEEEFDRVMMMADFR